MTARSGGQSAQSETITVIGAGFQRGLTLQVTNPPDAAHPTSVIQTFNVTQIMTPNPPAHYTAFQVSLNTPTAGNYIFHVTNPDGAVSNVALFPLPPLAGLTWRTTG